MGSKKLCIQGITPDNEFTDLLHEMSCHMTLAFRPPCKIHTSKPQDHPGTSPGPRMTPSCSPWVWCLRLPSSLHSPSTKFCPHIIWLSERGSNLSEVFGSDVACCFGHVDDILVTSSFHEEHLRLVWYWRELLWSCRGLISPLLVYNYLLSPCRKFITCVAPSCLATSLIHLNYTLREVPPIDHKLEQIAKLVFNQCVKCRN